MSSKNGGEKCMRNVFNILSQNVTGEDNGSK